jgi:hypothetical protein
MSTETQLKKDVRQMTGYTHEQALSPDGLDAAYRNAKRHIRVRKSLPPEVDYDWFDTDKPDREEALFWWTCLFTKVQTGEFDSQAIQMGAIDQNTLLSKDNDSVTIWYRNAERAVRSIGESGLFSSAAPRRPAREYEEDDFTIGGSSSGDAEL